MIELMYSLTTAIPVTLAAIGVGIGQGKIGNKALEAIYTQPSATNDITKVSVIGMALTETAGILGTVISIILILNNKVPANITYAAYGKIGIALAIGISGFVAAIASSLPAQATCETITRQPFFASKVMNLMLITQTLIMTPNIFGFLISLLINNAVYSANSLVAGLQLLAAGISIGIGSIGPSIGLSLFAYSACKAVGINRKAYSKILSFTFVCEAIIETPLIFALLVSLSILTIPVNQDTSLLKGIAFIAAACCMGLSTLGTGYSSGRTGSSATLEIAANPENSSMISKVGLLALAMIDTFAIYGLLTAMMLIFMT